MNIKNLINHILQSVMLTKWDKWWVVSGDLTSTVSGFFSSADVLMFSAALDVDGGVSAISRIGRILTPDEVLN